MSEVEVLIFISDAMIKIAILKCPVYELDFTDLFFSK